MTPDDLSALIVHRMRAREMSALELAQMADVSVRSVHEWMAGHSLLQVSGFLTALECLGVQLRLCGNPHDRTSPDGRGALPSSQAEI